MEKWEQLIAARENLHLSQAEVARRLEVGLATYQHWEQGYQKPRQRHMRDLRELFGPQMVYRERNVGSEEQSGHARTKATSHRHPVGFPEELIMHEENQELSAVLATNLTAHLWSLAHKKHATSNRRRGLIQQALKKFDAVNRENTNYQVTRQKAMSALATLPLVTLGLVLPGREIVTARHGEAMAQCLASVEACWELYERGGVNELLLGFQCVSWYLAVLRQISQTSLRYREEALRLATRYALLKTFFGWECAGANTTLAYAREAVALSREADDLSLQLSAYSKLAWTCAFAKKDWQALTTAQEARDVLERAGQRSAGEPVPASIRGGTYSTLAMAQARNGLPSDEAIARAMERDPGTEVYAYQDFTRSTMLLEAGWIYCYQGNHEKTAEMLEQRLDLETFEPLVPQSEVGRVRTMNILALSSLKAMDRDLERTVHYWTAAVEGARALRSDVCFHTALTTYEHMLLLWPCEVQVRALRDYLAHWEER
ncbi:MAG TPA: helix-turn-helix transcriptional regulator [Ktedonobacteraceae bacterium]|jgi:transcriptional regulator with XRE-family HTH domain